VLSGLQRFGSYGALLLADGAIRVVVLLPLVVVASPAVAAVAIVAAAWGGAVAPALAPRTDPLAAPLARAALRDELNGRDAAAPSLLRSMRFAGPIAIIAAAEQVLVSGGALLVGLTDADATAAAGTVFAATMLVRAPVFLFQGVAAFLLPTLTGFHERGEHGRFIRRLGVMSAGMVALGGILVAGSLLMGPWTMKTLFGPTFVVGAWDLTMLSVGVTAYLVAATLSQGTLARDAAPTAAAIWAAGAAVFVVLELGLDGTPFHRVSVAFTVATTLAALAFVPVVMRGSRR
jgi:O-antigen/teichoic acid export membrane protein